MLNCFKGKKILIAGGSGFIGRALASQLVPLGAEIHCIGLTGNNVLFTNKKINHISVDIRDKSALQDKLRNLKFSYVFNLGGYVDHCPYFSGGREVINTHYNGTLNLLDITYHTRLLGFVQIGSSDEYGNANPPQAENMREMPISPYSAAKTGISHLIQALHRTENFPGVIVRFFLLYGPDQNENRFIPQIIHGCLENKRFPTSSGIQQRDFCYIDDAIKGLLLAAISAEAKGEIFNIASGLPISIKSVIEKIISIIGKGKAEFGKYPNRPGENMALYADVSKAKKILNWEPSVSFDKGLLKTISWFKTNTS